MQKVVRNGAKLKHQINAAKEEDSQRVSSIYAVLQPTKYARLKNCKIRIKECKKTTLIPKRTEG